VSVSLVRRLEQGQRHTVSIATLHKLAGALDVEAGTLLGKQRHWPGEASGVQQIRRVLTSVDDLLDEVVDDGEPVGQGQAQRLVDYAWGLY
jgi:transcriptional regulator with XRE-family HTH domain